MTLLALLLSLEWYTKIQKIIKEKFRLINNISDLKKNMSAVCYLGLQQFFSVAAIAPTNFLSVMPQFSCLSGRVKDQHVILTEVELSLLCHCLHIFIRIRSDLTVFNLFLGWPNRGRYCRSCMLNELPFISAINIHLYPCFFKEWSTSRIAQISCLNEYQDRSVFCNQSLYRWIKI